MTLTKEHIVDSIHKKIDLPKTKSAELLESVLEIIKKTLENDEDVLISRFGKFYLKEKTKPRGRSPLTKEEAVVGSTRTIAFKCSPVLRDRINRNLKVSR